MKQPRADWAGSIAYMIVVALVCTSADASTAPTIRKSASAAVTSHPYDPQTRTVIGLPAHHVVQTGDTFLDIARNFKLGFNEMEALYPRIDPWIPPSGIQLLIPSQRVLPRTVESGIIINLAELRLYYYFRAGPDPVVQTFPIGIGDRGWPTPLGSFSVGEKRENPTWYVPPSLRGKYGVDPIPPGPKNPLGRYWIRLSQSNYGIHGTNNPWSVGRQVTHGCIRLYPEDIEYLFGVLQPGTPITIIYEPIKIGLLASRIYAEVHGDPYERIDDFMAYGVRRLQESQMKGKVDLDRFRRLLEKQSGLAVDVTWPDWRP